MQRGNRWLSRKFLVAIGVIIATIAYGLGYDLDPELTAILIGAEGALWIVVEGVIDIIKKS